MRDPGVYLTAGQMPAFAGLGALCHFDLQLLSAVEVGACYAKTAGSDLLDSRAAQRIVQPVRGLTALTGVGLTAQGIHCHGKALMGLLGNGAVAHGPGFEAFYNAFHRLHLVQRHTAVGIGFQIQKPAQRMGDLQIVHHRGVLLEDPIVSRSGRFLQQLDGERIVHVIFRRGTGAQLMGPDCVERGVDTEAEWLKGLVMLPLHAFTDLFHADSFDAAYRIGKVAVDDPAADTDTLKNLCCLIGLDRGDAHLGSDLYDPAKDGVVVIIYGNSCILVQHVEADQFFNAFLRQIGVDGLGAVAQKCCEMMHGTRFSAFQDQRQGCALLGAHEIFLNG